MISNLENITDLFDEFFIIKERVLQPVKENENTPNINFDGTEQAEWLFVFGAHLQGVDADMIHKLIHNAMKLNREVVSFMYLSDNQNISFEEVIKITSSKRLIVWGEREWLGAEMASYTISKLNKASVLVVEAPSVYHTNIELKTKLWNSIQLLTQA